MSRSFWQLWIALLILKLTIAIGLPLSSDEAYYWVWGQNLQLSYYDHPGMIAWLNALGAWLGQFLIHDIATLARVPGVLLLHFVPLIWIQILDLRGEGNNRMAVKLMILFSLFPLLGLTSLIMTPDAPLIFFWSLGIWFFCRALERQRLSDYILLGVSLGLGFCSKYHIVLFVPAALLALAVQKQFQKVRITYVAATILAGLLFCLPVLVWNYQNQFISFQFQLRHGLEAAATNRWRFPLEYLGGQIGILFPTLIWVAVKTWKNPNLKRFQYLHAFAWFPIGFFFLTSLRTKVEANWPVAAYPAFAALALFGFQDFKKIRRFTLGFWAAVWVLVLTQAAFQWLPSQSSKLKTYELVKYNPLVEKTKIKKPFFASSYQMAAYLSYKTRSQIYKLKGISRIDFYDFQTLSMPAADIDTFYVAVEPEQKLPQALYQLGYQVISYEPISEEPDLKIWEVTRAKDSDRK